MNRNGLMLAASPIQAPTLFQRPRRWARHASVTGSASHSDICPSQSVLESAALLSTRARAMAAGTGDQRRRNVRTTIAAQMRPTTRLQASQSSSAGKRSSRAKGRTSR